MSDIYRGSFDSWQSVQSCYETIDPEPDEVLYAQYSYENYQGWADVIYRNGDKFYWVRGSHCSCYGLEGQWDPEEYSAELFVAAWEKANYRDIPSFVLDRVKQFLENKYYGA